MGRLRIALAALCALTLGAAAPLAAHAAPAKDDKPITKDQRDKGMKEAPAIVQKAGVPCDVTDAYYLGSNSSNGKTDIYEVACKQGLGYMLLAAKDKTTAYDCLATANQPNIYCRLPGNANPAAGLASITAKAGLTCTPAKGRYVGANATTTVYEVACTEGPGYILQTPAVGATASATTAIPCIETEASPNLVCKLTTSAQDQAAITAFVAKSGRQCQISKTRYIGTGKEDGDAYFEIACGAQPGFVLALNKAGAFDRTVGCAQAQGLGGCTLTSGAAVAAQATTDYTRLVKAAGFDCDVSKYRTVGTDANKDDIEELACSNRPDGRVALFPAGGAGQVRLLDCVQSEQLGASGACTLTSKTTVLAKYTAGLLARGKSTCKVSDARFLGSTSVGDSYIETACADGGSGWVMEVSPTDQVKTLLNCAQASQAHLACQLPSNTKH